LLRYRGRKVSALSFQEGEIGMVKIALVGAGYVADRHVEALQSLDDARIVAIVDVVKERADRLAATCGAQAYEALEMCLDRVDIVYILTPPTTHRELAFLAFNAGRHVLVEKPIAIELSDAQAIVNGAAEAKVKLFVGFNMRFREGFARLKDTVQSGKLGTPIQFWSQRLGTGPYAKGPNWRTTPGLLCGMSIESLSHDIDLIRWTMGEIRDVRARVYESHGDLPGFDYNANAVFSLENGATAVIHASWSSHLTRNSRDVTGSKGTAMITGSGLWTLDQFHLKTAEMEHETIEVLNEPLDASSYQKLSRHFIDWVARSVEPPVTAQDAIAALKISHAIITSHRENRVVRLQEG
jgi:myo-inositol 2-dehydrogenase/D-chiro-inositol 1-dehydrogenase